MKFRVGLFVVLASLLCVSSLPAQASDGYRLVPLSRSGVSIFDLNQRGEVVGMTTAGGVTHAFRWRAGRFTDLNNAIDPASDYTQAAGINDHSTIVGDDNTNDSFTGFVLRGTIVSPLTVVPGESNVFPFDINNRGQIIADSEGGAQSGSFLIDGNHVERLEGLPGESDSMHALGLNEAGVVIGNTRTSAGFRALLWQDGAIENLGVASGATESFAHAINIHNQVVGFVSLGGRSQAMRWRDGRMTLLRKLAQDQASSAAGINDFGAIVGGVTVLQPEYRETAVLWLGCHVVELDRLVRADDPLKPYVHLRTAHRINNRGDIVASGYDSRRPNVLTTYFMTLFASAAPPP